MDDTGTYGHFGQATYNHNEQAWSFGRSHDTDRILQPIGNPLVVAEPNSHVSDTKFSKDGREGPARRRGNQIKALVKLHPEVQPASSLLPDLARVSEAVEESSFRYEPAKGNVFARGTIIDERAGREAQLVAFPTGPTGSDLRVMQVRKQRRGWHDVKDVYLKVPTISGEEAIWRGPGVPIQFVVFANPVESAQAYLAIRLITKTIIVRPRLRKGRLPVGSRLDFSSQLSLEIDQTGGSPHADVAFNPWNPRQLALLDQAGTWSVWEIDDKLARRPKKIHTMSMPSDDVKESKQFLDRCWGRVTWISGRSLLAVCTRREVKIYGLWETTPVELEVLNAGLSDLGWLLDMVSIPTRSDFLVVLTSVHIVVYHINVTKSHDLETRTVAQVRHYCNPDDITLQANMFTEADGKFTQSSSFKAVLILL